MKEYLIGQPDEGQTLIKYLSKVLPGAGNTIFFKALRKKNIVLNGAKAAGKELLKNGDSVKVFFSDEVIDKFSPKGGASDMVQIPRSGIKEFKKNIVFEDKNILIVNKEAGLLTQSDHSGDISLNDILLSYLENETGHYAVKPSVCNRLDRNTSGLVLCGKTQKGLSFLSGLIRERSIKKLYRAVVYGDLKSPLSLGGYINKDRNENIVRITDTPEEGSEEISTEITPVSKIVIKGCTLTLINALLITGKPHQIRAHMLSAGYPVIGDQKYFTEESRVKSEELNIRRQLLNAYKIEFPLIKGEFSSLSKKTFESPVDSDFNKVLKYR